jgi:hypothetical protein
MFMLLDEVVETTVFPLIATAVPNPEPNLASKPVRRAD